MFYMQINKILQSKIRIMNGIVKIIRLSMFRNIVELL